MLVIIFPIRPQGNFFTRLPGVTEGCFGNDGVIISAVQVCETQTRAGGKMQDRKQLGEKH